MKPAHHDRFPHSRPDSGDESVSLSLNLFPATFSRSRVRVWAGKWTGNEEAAQMRAGVPGLVTWRDRDDGSRMYAWHKSGLMALPGFQEVTVELSEAPALFQKLVNDAVRDRFALMGFTEKSHGFVNYGRGSLYADIPALAASATEPIGIYSKIICETFFTKTDDQLWFGLAADVLYTTRLDITAQEWVAAGLDSSLRGKYVVLLDGSAEAERYPRLRGVIGRVDGIRGDRCVLTDLREPGLAEVSLSSIAPEPTRQNLATYLNARFERAFRANEQLVTARLRKLLRPQKRHQLAQAAINRLQQEGSLEVLSDVSVSFGTMVTTSPSRFAARRLTEPVFSFDRGGGKYGRKVDQGIRDFGPYDHRGAQRMKPRVMIVALKENEGEVRQAVQKLAAGIKTSQNVFCGMRDMYRVDPHFTYAFAPPSSGSLVKRYCDAIHKGLSDAPGSMPKFDLIITVISESHRALPDADNPYFQTKALALVADGTPTQAITIEKLRYPDERLQYVFNTMALSCYAKQGGTSHVLKLPEPADDEPTELIFGIGRSVRRATRLGASFETIGFATVFRANGEYLYNDCTPYCDDENYERALEATVRRTIERVAAFEQLADGASLRLIFHVPRRAGRREVQPILNAVGKLPRFKIKFALVHVNDDHHLQAFDHNNVTPASRGKPKPDAALLAPRGVSIVLGPRERLVTFIGVDQYRGNGSPSPLRLSLDRRSTFKDIDYLAQQLYLLSSISVRTLNPGVLPVTISYPEDLAMLTGALRGVQNWSVELIQERLGRRLWFV